MTLYDFVWLCMTMYENVWLYMTMYDKFTTTQGRDMANMLSNKIVLISVHFSYDVHVFCLTTWASWVDQTSPLNCSSSNVVYCLKCDKNNCRQIYIGQTQRKLKESFLEHKTLVRTQTKDSIGDHFNLPGHSVANMKILALEKVKQQGTQIIEKRESFWLTNSKQNSKV